MLYRRSFYPIFRVKVDALFTKHRETDGNILAVPEIERKEVESAIE